MMIDIPKADDNNQEPILSEKPTEILPEVEMYLSLIVLVFIIDQRRFDLVCKEFFCIFFFYFLTVS